MTVVFFKGAYLFFALVSVLNHFIRVRVLVVIICGISTYNRFVVWISLKDERFKSSACKVI